MSFDAFIQTQLRRSVELAFTRDEIANAHGESSRRAERASNHVRHHDAAVRVLSLEHEAFDGDATRDPERRLTELKWKPLQWLRERERLVRGEAFVVTFAGHAGARTATVRTWREVQQIVRRMFKLSHRVRDSLAELAKTGSTGVNYPANRAASFTLTVSRANDTDPSTWRVSDS